MKVGFFLLKFPLSSETFVLNQITAFIDMGFEVEIVALQKATHKTPTWHGLNTTLPPEPAGYRTNLRAKWRNCATEPVRPCAAFIVKYLAGAQPQTLWCRVVEPDFVCHLRPGRNTVSRRCVHRSFWPCGVTAAKLRELGVIHGKIATIFHGIDISSREVLNHYTPEYQQLFRRGDLMLPISDLWAGRLQKWAARGKNRRIAHGRRYDAL